MAGTIKVGLVDDHVLLRKGLASLLVDKGFHVSLRADNGEHFIHLLRDETHPNVVLLDINMPIMDGYATAKWVKHRHPEIKILALSMYDDEYAIIRMLHCGARGYILKDCEPEEVSTAIHSIVGKGFYHSEMVTSKLIHSLDQPFSYSSNHELNDKEMQFLQLNCSEKTYKEIAAEMHLSPRTIDGYRDILFKKLGIRSRVGLVLYAIKNRLVQI